MKKIGKDGWLSLLKPGDAGLILAKNFFSKLQNWYRNKVEKISERASHAFIMKRGVEISEANGYYISEDTVTKYIDDSKKVWIFRNLNMTNGKMEGIIDYCEGAEENDATYSVKGIYQFGINYVLHFFGKKFKFKDQSGSFCGEYLNKALVKKGIPVMKQAASYEATPSLLLHYFLSEEGKADQWYLAAYYDGENGYFVQ